MGTTEDQYCLRWDDFQNCIKTTFTDLRGETDFMDITLSCDGGEQIKAHKVILSAGSTTFKALLKNNPAQNSVILLWGISSRDLSAVLDFMYHGEVNVEQDHLKSFLAVAERLRVRGLCQNDGTSPASSKTASDIIKYASRPRPNDFHGVRAPTTPDPSSKKKCPSTPVGDEDEVVVGPQSKVKLEVEYDQSMHESEFDDYSGYEENMLYIDEDHSSDGLLGSNQSGQVKQSRMRTMYSRKQLLELEKEFQDSQFVDSERKAQLAHLTGLTELQIKIWFQNRRMKWKKEINKRKGSNVDP